MKINKTDIRLLVIYTLQSWNLTMKWVTWVVILGTIHSYFPYNQQFTVTPTWFIWLLVSNFPYKTILHVFWHCMTCSVLVHLKDPSKQTNLSCVQNNLYTYFFLYSTGASNVISTDPLGTCDFFGLCLTWSV